MLASALLIATVITMIVLLGCVVVAVVELVRTLARALDHLP